MVLLQHRPTAVAAWADIDDSFLYVSGYYVVIRRRTALVMILGSHVKESSSRDDPG